MKRLFPKKYQATYLNQPRVDHVVASTYNQQRSKTTRGSRSDTEPNQNNSFMTPVPETKGLGEEQAGVQKTRDKLLAFEAKSMLELYHIWLAGEPLGTHRLDCIIIDKYTNFKLMLFICRNKCMFVQEYENTRRISYTYDGSKRAFGAYVNGRINWALEQPINT